METNRELVFRKIKSLDFRYEITSDGRFIRNVKSKKYLKIKVSIYGYHVCNVKWHGKCKTLRIGRLVAECWILNYNNYPEVDHIDRNKLNDDYTNLRWCTRSMNSKNRTFTEAWHKHCIEQAQNQKGKEVWINGEYFPTLSKAAQYLADRHQKTFVAMKARLHRRPKYILGDNISYKKTNAETDTL